MRLTKPVLAAVAAFLLVATAGAADLVTEVPPRLMVTGASPQPLPPRAMTAEDLETFMDGVMADQLKWQHLAGATLAIVKDGRVLLAKGYGYADAETGAMVEADKTLFRPGSVSKLFTWTALMQLVEQGKVDLDADVNTYLEQFQIPATYPQPITARNLLTHTPGLEDVAVGISVGKVEDLVPLAESLGSHMPNRIRPPLTDFNGGNQVSYSNWGAALAGLIVENLSGMPFDDYADKHLFAPLGMTSTTFREPLPKELEPRMSAGHAWEAGVFKKKPFELFHNIGPAGCASSTATDMAKFMLAHLNNGALGDARILKEETAKLMHKRALGLNPHLSGSALGFYETYANGRRLISHAGDTAWFHSDLHLLLEENLGIFISYNTLPTAKIPMRQAVLEAIMDRYYPAQLPPVKPQGDFKDHAERYTGTWSFTRHNYTRIEKAFGLFGAMKVSATPEDTLLVKIGDNVSQWVEVAPSVFRKIDNDEMMAFSGDQDGQAQYLNNPLGVPFIGAYRLKTWQTPLFHQVLLGFGALCFLGAIWGALRNWRADRSLGAGARRTRRLAALVGLLHLAFFAGFGIAVASLFGEGYDWHPSFKVFLALPLLAIPLTGMLVFFTVRMWREGPWGWLARTRYTIVVAMTLAVLWSLHYWHLVGYRFT